MNMKRNLVALSVLTVFSTQVHADREYPEIYPFVPVETEYIYSEVKRMAEETPIKNFVKIHKEGLYQGKTKDKPWTSTFWPLNRGLIADSYSNSSLSYYNPFKVFSWTNNRNRYRDRKLNFHDKVDQLDSDDLAKLAPSEKYDLLLGDKSFDLTNRLWSYMQAWGSMKEYGYLHTIDKVGGESVARANELINLGWQNQEGNPLTFDEAFVLAVQQRGGLAEFFAQKMVDAGEASNLQAALPAATEKALAERDNYVIKKKNTYMATWEGICHGWATAAGNLPRPRKAVTFKLPDGRDLKFYPEDIKGLISLMWANSTIQDGKFLNKEGKNIGGGIIMQGLRCNEKKPRKDEWGRYYDHRPDAFSKKLEPRCVGVHPAIWHLGLVNIIGKQGRSFIVERKIKAAVDNHPMWSYKMEYFNPYTGVYSEKLEDVYMPFSEKHDQFAKFRNPETRFIVGVKTEMVYLDWARPKRRDTNSEEDDCEVAKSMLYDLELDANGNIIGGQWRTTEVGKGGRSRRASRRSAHARTKERLNHNQPDFFWVVTKDWKPFFQEEQTVWINGATKQLEPWSDTSSVPPAEWKTLAKGGPHAFVYQQTHDYGWNEKCQLEHEDTHELVYVPCEYKINKPQPMIRVVNKLIELSQ